MLIIDMATMAASQQSAADNSLSFLDVPMLGQFTYWKPSFHRKWYHNNNDNNPLMALYPGQPGW